MRSGPGSSSTRSCWSRRAITRSPCRPPPCSVGPQGVYAYVVKADNTVEMRPIKVSAANAGAPMALIESGVSAGDQVVVDGQLKLRPGASVKMISATPPPASVAAPATSTTAAITPAVPPTTPAPR